MNCTRISLPVRQFWTTSQMEAYFSAIHFFSKEAHFSSVIHDLEYVANSKNMSVPPFPTPWWRHCSSFLFGTCVFSLRNIETCEEMVAAGNLICCGQNFCISEDKGKWLETCLVTLQGCKILGFSDGWYLHWPTFHDYCVTQILFK